MQGSGLISEPICVSSNKESSDVTASKFHSPESSSVSGKALIKDTPNDTTQAASVTVKSEPIAPLFPCGNSVVCDHNIQEPVVVTIQAFIRGFLVIFFCCIPLSHLHMILCCLKFTHIPQIYQVRRELPKHKNVIKLQAAVRGHLVRRQAVGTLRCALAIIKTQALIRARRARRLSEKLEKLEVEEEDEKLHRDMQNPATLVMLISILIITCML